MTPGHMGRRRSADRPWHLRRARRQGGGRRPRDLDPDRHPDPCAGGFRHPHPLWLRCRGNAGRRHSPTRSSTRARQPGLSDLRHRLPRHGFRPRHQGHPFSGGPSSAKIAVGPAPSGQAEHGRADIVEVAPAYDHADINAIAASNIAMYYLGFCPDRRDRDRG